MLSDGLHLASLCENLSQFLSSKPVKKQAMLCTLIHTRVKHLPGCVAVLVPKTLKFVDLCMKQLNALVPQLTGRILYQKVSVQLAAVYG